jgi:macrolide-specific efflux system membrane fusion protein
MMKKASNRPLKTLLILMLLSAAALGIYGVSGGLKATEPEYVTAKVKRGDIENAVLATGKLDAFERVDVGAQVTGEVTSLKVKMADAVVKGQLLAEIDSLQQRNNLRNAEAALNVIRANKKAKQAQLAQANAQFIRQKRMLSQQASSREELENADMALKMTRAERVAIESQLVQAQIEVDKKKLDLSYTKVLAPKKGIVIAIVAQQGQTLNASQNAPTVVKLAQLDVMTIKVQISEADITRVRQGQKAYFSTFAEPGKRYDAQLRVIELAPESIMKQESSGQASPVSAAANGSVYYNALLDVPNPENRLRIAMTAQVTLPLQEAKNVLLIPARAVTRVNDKLQQVEVLNKNGQKERRDVQTGITNSVDIEITQGLKIGEVVVLNAGLVRQTSEDDAVIYQ